MNAVNRRGIEFRSGRWMLSILQVGVLGLLAGLIGPSRADGADDSALATRPTTQPANSADARIKAMEERLAALEGAERAKVGALPDGVARTDSKDLEQLRATVVGVLREARDLDRRLKALEGTTQRPVGRSLADEVYRLQQELALLVRTVQDLRERVQRLEYRRP